MSTLGSNSFWWPDWKRGPWRVQMTWAELGGRAEPVGFAIEWAGSKNAAQPVTGDLLRKLVFGELVREHRAELAQTVQLLAAGKGKLAGIAKGQIPIYNAGGGRYPPGTLERVAEVYRDAYRQGRPTTRAVMEAIGCTETAAYKWVRKAREAELLGPTLPGKPGGIEPARRKRSKGRTR